MSLSLLTDLYQLTMAYGYYKTGIANRRAVFHLFFRRHPFQGNYTIACGLQQAIDYLREFRFCPDDIAYLNTLCGNDQQHLFNDDFLDYLTQFQVTATMHALPEGTLAMPHLPLLRIEGTLIEAQLFETTLLNILNFQTLIATKAARICRAAGKDQVLEFGLRRAQGIDGSLSASRAAFVGGCAATSNVLAGKKYGIPVRGTHAHSWVMSFDTEEEAFEQYAKAMPNNCVFLVDTYNTLNGVKNAIKVGKKIQNKGYQLAGIRLDSGNLAQLSIEARKMLDQAGFPNTQIVASNDLDEHAITELKQQNACIAVWGVGTRLVTAYDQPALGGVYKLGAIQNEQQQWQYRIKRSETPIKTSNPGKLQIRRFFHPNGQIAADVLYDEIATEQDLNNTPQIGEQAIDFDGKPFLIQGTSHADLLQVVFEQGKIYPYPNLHEIRQFAQTQLNAFDTQKPYPYGLAKKLYELKCNIIATTGAVIDMPN